MLHSTQISKNGFVLLPILFLFLVISTGVFIFYPKIKAFAAPPQGKTGTIYALGDIPDQNGFNPGISALDVSSKQEIATISLGGRPVDSVIDLQGNFIYVVDQENNTVQIVNTTNNSIVNTISISLSLGPITINPVNNFVYVAGGDGTQAILSVIDPSTQTVVDSIALNIPDLIGTYSLAFVPSGNKLFMSSITMGDHYFVYVIDISSKQVIATIPLIFPGAYGIVMNGAGTRAYIAQDSIVSIIDVSTYQIIKRILVGSGGGSLVISHDDSRLYTANGDSGTISIIDTSSNKVIDTIPIFKIANPGAIRMLGIDSTDKKLFVVNAGANTISIVDINTKQIESIIQSGTATNALLFKP